MKTISKNDGFTLLEVIISTAILCFISVFILDMFIASASLNARAKDADTATVMAVTELEKIKGSAKLSDYLAGKNTSVDGGGATVVVYYYDEDWQSANSAESAKFYLETRVEPLDSGQSNDALSGVPVGALFAVELNIFDVSAGAASDNGESAKPLARLETKKYFPKGY